MKQLEKQTCSKATVTAVLHGFLAPERFASFQHGEKTLWRSSIRRHSPRGLLLMLARTAQAGGAKLHYIHREEAMYSNGHEEQFIKRSLKILGVFDPSLGSQAAVPLSPAPLRQTLPSTSNSH